MVRTRLTSPRGSLYRAFTQGDTRVGLAAKNQEFSVGLPMFCPNNGEKFTILVKIRHTNCYKNSLNNTIYRNTKLALRRTLRKSGFPTEHCCLIKFEIVGRKSRNVDVKF